MVKPLANGRSWLEWLELKRWVQFIRRVLAMEGAIETLKAETESLQTQVLQLQREVDRFQVQLSTLATTIQTTIDDKVRIAVLETVPALIVRELEKTGKPKR